MSQRKATTQRSGFLLQDEGQTQNEPFRYSYTMKFPPAEQKALKLLAKLLYFREDYRDSHFPLFRGFHNLAHLDAAAQDVLSVARTLAAVAADVDGELSKREREAAKLADRYAVKAARLAAEIRKAIDEIAPRMKRGGGR
jgi:hypothetical protein